LTAVVPAKERAKRDFFVVPANAGTQRLLLPTPRKKRSHWVPAFAGMTGFFFRRAFLQTRAPDPP
jgi:hypothetical protein